MFTVKPFGKVVICAGTTGYNLDFDVRYLWMRQKEIIGSHFANAYECKKANELIETGRSARCCGARWASTASPRRTS